MGRRRRRHEGRLRQDPVDEQPGHLGEDGAELYRAVISEAHKKSLPFAVHLFLSRRARACSTRCDLIAHSVRDNGSDAELIASLKRRKRVRPAHADA